MLGQRALLYCIACVITPYLRLIAQLPLLTRCCRHFCYFHTDLVSTVYMFELLACWLFFISLHLLYSVWFVFIQRLPMVCTQSTPRTGATWLKAIRYKDTSMHLRFALSLHLCTFIQDRLTIFIFLGSSFKEVMTPASLSSILRF